MTATGAHTSQSWRLATASTCRWTVSQTGMNLEGNQLATCRIFNREGMLQRWGRTNKQTLGVDGHCDNLNIFRPFRTTRGSFEGHEQRIAQLVRASVCSARSCSIPLAPTNKYTQVRAFWRHKPLNQGDHPAQTNGGGKSSFDFMREFLHLWAKIRFNFFSRSSAESSLILVIPLFVGRPEYLNVALSGGDGSFDVSYVSPGTRTLATTWCCGLRLGWGP